MNQDAVVSLFAGRMQRRTMAMVELGVVFSIIMLQIWLWQSRSIKGTLFTYTLVPGMMIAGWIVRKETFSTLGLGGKRFVIPAGALLAGKLVVEHYHLFPRPTMIGGICFAVAGYFVWALLQEIILNGFFAIRLGDCFADQAVACVCTGIIFCLCHTPNLVLMLVTLPWGVGASYYFLNMRRKRSHLLYLLTFVHTAVGYGLTVCLPHLVSWHHPMAVGPKFFQ